MDKFFALCQGIKNELLDNGLTHFALPLEKAIEALPSHWRETNNDAIMAVVDRLTAYGFTVYNYTDPSVGVLRVEWHVSAREGFDKHVRGQA